MRKGGDMIMQISRLTLVNLMIAVILLSSPLVVQMTSSAAYDPWADLDDDGDIDIFDIVDIAGRYGTKGDSTKDVFVDNWPIMQNVNATWSATQDVNVIVTGHRTRSLNIASNVAMSGGSYWDSSVIPIDGFAKVTVLVALLPTANNEIEVWARNPTTGVDYMVEEVFDFPYWFVRTYDVMATRIWIRVWNLALTPCVLAADIYLTA